jgi:hypothetical protein
MRVTGSCTPLCVGTSYSDALAVLEMDKWVTRVFIDEDRNNTSGEAEATKVGDNRAGSERTN